MPENTQKVKTVTRYYTLKPEDLVCLEAAARREKKTEKQAVNLALTGVEDGQVGFNAGAVFKDHIRVVLILPEPVMEALERDAKAAGNHPSDIFRKKIRDYVNRDKLRREESKMAVPGNIHV
jgi:hypothetical protein